MTQRTMPAWKASLWVFLGIPAAVVAFGAASFILSVAAVAAWPLLVAALPVAILIGVCRRKG